MFTNMINIKIVDSPQEAQNYDDSTTLLRVSKAVIVGKGMESGAPSVDLQLEDANGNKYLIMATGNIVEALGKAIEGKRILDTQVTEPSPDKGLH